MKFWRCYSYMQEYGKDKKVYLSRKKTIKKQRPTVLEICTNVRPAKSVLL